MSAFRAVLAGSIVSLAACADVTAPTVAPSDASFAAAPSGVSAPKTDVNATATITTAGGVRILGLNGPELPRNGGNLENDQCRGNGELWKRQPRTGVWSQVAGAPHAQCTVTEGAQTITVTFDVGPANYVLSPSGNIQLNFAALCDVLGCLDRALHYKKNSNSAQGMGTLYGVGSDGSSWQISLAQVTGLVGTIGLDKDTRSVSLVTTEVGGRRAGYATISWTSLPARN